MKILQVMPEFGLAGAEIMCENLTYELLKLGHKVTIVSLYNYKSAITDRLEEHGVKIFYLNKTPGPDVLLIGRIRNILKEVKPDIIHTHRYVLRYVIPANLLLNIKVIHTVHTIASKEQKGIGIFLSKIFYRLNLAQPVALSNQVRNTIYSVYGLKMSVPVIFNGINLEKYGNRNKLKLEHSERFVFLNIGRFVYAKNHETLIHAFAIFHKKYSNSYLYLIGQGSEENKIKHLVKSLSLTDCVEFLGTKAEVSYYLSTTDCFILPSRYEGMPMTLIEAMASGMPIIASNVGGIPDMLTDNENAILIDPTVEGVLGAMEQIYQEPALRNKLAHNAYIRSKDFSAASMAECYIKFYRQILSND